MHDGDQVAKVVDIRYHEDLGNFVLVRYYMIAKEITKAFNDESLAKNDPWTNKPIPANTHVYTNWPDIVNEDTLQPRKPEIVIQDKTMVRPNTSSCTLRLACWWTTAWS